MDAIDNSILVKKACKVNYNVLQPVPVSIDHIPGLIFDISVYGRLDFEDETSR